MNFHFIKMLSNFQGSANVLCPIQVQGGFEPCNETFFYEPPTLLVFHIVKWIHVEGWLLQTRTVMEMLAQFSAICIVGVLNIRFM